MSHPFLAPIFRVGIRPELPAPDPFAMLGRRRGLRRPHTDATVAAVRRLIEESVLTMGEIAARTGVGRASICRWTRDQGWTRPPFAPRATDTVPRPRAGQKLKLRLLAERLRALAERQVEALEAADAIDTEALMQALQVLKMARLEAMGGRRRRRWYGETMNGHTFASRQDAERTALKEMARGGVDIDRAPKAALDLVIDANAPPEDHAALKARKRRGGYGRRGGRRTRAQHHAWMTEREGE